MSEFWNEILKLDRLWGWEDTISEQSPPHIEWKINFIIELFLSESWDGTYYTHIWLAKHAKDVHLLPIKIMMTQSDLFKLIQFCIEIGVELGHGIHHCEISTNVRNEIPNLDPSIIELVRDAFYPIQHKVEGPHYKVVGSACGTQIIAKEGFYSTFEAEEFIEQKKSEGFKAIWHVYRY